MKILPALLITSSLVLGNSLESFLSIKDDNQVNTKNKEYYLITNIGKRNNVYISINTYSNENTTAEQYQQVNNELMKQTKQVVNYYKKDKEEKNKNLLYESIEKKIERIIVIPKTLLKKEIDERVSFKFTYNYKIEDINFIEKSEYEELNKAIITALKNINILDNKEYEVNLHFQFR